MKKMAVLVCLLLLGGVIALLSTGCWDLNTPPSIESVQSHYQDYSGEIQIIVDYLTALGYEDVYIIDNSGTMLADLEHIPIENRAVFAAVNTIIDKGLYRNINKNGDTISLLQWTGLRDIGCGIACTINGENTPEIEFVTQLVPMSDNGWYYYVSDYNVWRNMR